jgi:hypothetical protein
MRRLALLIAVPLCAVLAVLALVLGGEDAAPEAAAPAAAPAAAAERPRPAGVAAHLRALAGIAERHGGTRAAGTPGDRATADHLARRLRAAGYRVRFQEVPFRPGAADVPARVAADGGPALRRETDVLPMAGSGSGTVSGPVRAVGVRAGRASAAGCRAGDLARVGRGDVVLVQRGTCRLREKVLRAQAAGAAAVLVVNDGRAGRTGTFPGTVGDEPGVRVPALVLSSAAGARLARARRVAVAVDAARGERVTRNVIADAPGDAARTVLAGAHLDSVSAGAGLNDNGSGVAALLDTAERLAGRPGLRFAFWGAEELGLVGSRRFVAQGGARGLRAYVNLDMVGTPDGRTEVYGTGAVRDVLRRALRDQGRAAGTTELGSSSDHAPFARAGVPVGGVFTGLDRCYHRSCDDLGNVDAELAGDVAAAVARVLPRLARPRGG